MRKRSGIVVLYILKQKFYEKFRKEKFPRLFLVLVSSTTALSLHAPIHPIPAAALAPSTHPVGSSTRCAGLSPQSCRCRTRKCSQHAVLCLDGGRLRWSCGLLRPYLAPLEQRLRRMSRGTRLLHRAVCMAQKRLVNAGVKVVRVDQRNSELLL